MLDSFYAIKQKIKNKCVLLIVGDGELKEILIEQAYSLHFKVAIDTPQKDADIIFTSWCNDLTSLYSAMDLLVLSSRSEGTPLNIIEAQIAGIAVIAPKVGGIEDMVIENKTALLFSKSIDFEQKLVTLINDCDLLKVMGKNAAQYAQEKFNLPKMLETYENLYKQN